MKIVDTERARLCLVPAVGIDMLGLCASDYPCRARRQGLPGAVFIVTEDIPKTQITLLGTGLLESGTRSHEELDKGRSRSWNL